MLGSRVIDFCGAVKICVIKNKKEKPEKGKYSTNNYNMNMRVYSMNSRRKVGTKSTNDLHNMKSKKTKVES